MAKSSTSFKRGQSGNPGGRPKSGESFGDIFRNRLDKEKLCDVIIKRALEGDQQATNFIADRMEGKVVERQEVRTSTGIPELENLSDDELKELRDYVKKSVETLERRRKKIVHTQGKT